MLTNVPDFQKLKKNLYTEHSNHFRLESDGNLKSHQRNCGNLTLAGIITKLLLFVSDKAFHVSLASRHPIRNLSKQTLKMYWGERISLDNTFTVLRRFLCMRLEPRHGVDQGNGLQPIPYLHNSCHLHHLHPHFLIPQEARHCHCCPASSSMLTPPLPLTYSGRRCWTLQGWRSFLVFCSK